MLTKLTTIQPEQWKNLGTVLKPINNQGSINIRNSNICQDINNGVAILTADTTTLIGKDIDLDIMTPSKHIKLFKLLEGTNDVDIYDDPENEQYIATNGKIRIYLPKQIDVTALEAPNIDGISGVGTTISLDKDNKKEIDVIIKSANDISKPINLLIKDEQLMGFEVNEIGIYLFPNYTGEVNLNSQTADIVLKSYAFMDIPGEIFEISLGRRSNDSYLLFTGINTGFSLMSLHEEIDEGGSGDGLDLI